MSSNLPPGCSNNNIENAFGEDLPPKCENCEHCIEENEYICPLKWNYNMCPHICIIKNCAHCKKEMYIVPGIITKECIAHGWDNTYCCSSECAEKAQIEINESIKDYCDCEMEQGNENK